MMGNLIGIIDQGLIFSLVAMAVYMTSRVIKKDDLTVEGSFGLGGAITAVMLNSSISPWFALIVALIVGALAGTCTGLLYTRLRMNHLMAGLVTTTACFSLSLAAASANIPVREISTIFGKLAVLPIHVTEIVLLALSSAIMLLIVCRIIRSQMGLLLRATGDNPDILLHFGKSSSRYYVLGFALANAVTSFAGSLFVQWSGFFSITGNIGTLVTGLASLMIAELLTRTLGFTIIVAAILYQSIFATTLMIGIDPVWNNLVKALVMVLPCRYVNVTEEYAKRGISCLR